MQLNISENTSLQPYNTFRIEVKARYFVEIFSEIDLKNLFLMDIVRDQKILVLGGGSNLLFTEDFKGLVIKISIPGINYFAEANSFKINAGAGVVWNDLVQYCVSHDFAGLENLTLIPGTVGAAPVQNIGAYGVELKDVFSSCRAFNTGNGKIETFNAADCRFGYRDSIFKQELKGKYIITSVDFKLHNNQAVNINYGSIRDELRSRGIAHPGIKDVSDVVAHIRVNKLPDPSTIGNAGSFFKNPVISTENLRSLQTDFPEIVNYPAGTGKAKVAAGWLIEQCGYKGMVNGHTGTWKNQALVLVNHGGASGSEVYNFSEQIIISVYNKFGIRLEREVNVL